MRSLITVSLFAIYSASIFLYLISLGEVSSLQSSPTKPLSGVVLTTGKDTRVFEKAIHSALDHLVDVENFYIVTPDAKSLEERLSAKLGPRVIFVEESRFPFTGANVSEVMFAAVKNHGVYPMTGDSTFERTVWGRIGWFLQQLLKFYAGRVLELGDFVMLDSDVIWFKNISFLNSTIGDGLNRYNYASSGQYHANYISTLKKVGGVDMYEAKDGDVFRSGIVHHMVIVKKVLDDLVTTSEQLHPGQQFWQILLNVSALEMTCRAPRTPICGAGSTLSEYELYFNYARTKFPQTIAFRPLLWANGPSPGLLFWPPVDPTNNKIHADKHRTHWLGHRQSDVMEAFEKQMLSDKYQGYDYVGYHSYAKRRYFEMVQPDYLALCNGTHVPFNTTCSWRGFDERWDQTRTAESWFRDCGCYQVAAW